MLGPTFFTATARLSSGIPRPKYCTPMENEAPEAAVLMILSDMIVTLAPTEILSVRSFEYDAPILTKVGEYSSPVPSGADSVVTGISPKLIDFKLNPRLPRSPAFTATAP